MKTFVLAGFLIGLLVAGGCSDDVGDISSANYLMRMQHECWQNARASLATDSPNLTIFHGVHVFMSQRTPRRLAKDYMGDDKQAILDKLAEINREFQATLLSRLDLRGRRVTLKQGATIEQIREAFGKLDVKYLELQQLAEGKVG